MTKVTANDKRRSSWKTRTSTIVPARPEGTKAPVFIVSGSDGQVLHYRNFVGELDSERPVYALQPLALDTDLEPHTRIEDLAAEYVRDLLEFQPTGDFLLAGFCWSGLVTYEVARQLHERGHSPALVAIIDSYYCRPRTRTEMERQKFDDFFQRDLRGKAAWIVTRWRGLLHKARTRTRWRFHDFRRRHGMPTEPLPLKEAGERAWRRYVFDARPSTVPIMFFRAVEEGRDWTKPLAWWRALALGPFEMHELELPGIRHDNVIQEQPYVGELGALVTRVLDEAATARDHSRVAADNNRHTAVPHDLAAPAAAGQ